MFFYKVFHNKADFLSKLSSLFILYTVAIVQYSVDICVILLSLGLPLHFYVNLNYEIVLLE